MPLLPPRKRSKKHSSRVSSDRWVVLIGLAASGSAVRPAMTQPSAPSKEAFAIYYRWPFVIFVSEPHQSMTVWKGAGQTESWVQIGERQPYLLPVVGWAVECKRCSVVARRDSQFAAAREELRQSVAIRGTRREHLAWNATPRQEKPPLLRRQARPRSPVLLERAISGVRWVDDSE